MMKNVMTLILVMLSLTAFAQSEKLEGKWISKSNAADGELITCQFVKDQTLKMFINGK